MKLSTKAYHAIHKLVLKRPRFINFGILGPLSFTAAISLFIAGVFLIFCLRVLLGEVDSSIIYAWLGTLISLFILGRLFTVLDKTVPTNKLFSKITELKEEREGHEGGQLLAFLIDNLSKKFHQKSGGKFNAENDRAALPILALEGNRFIEAALLFAAERMELQVGDKLKKKLEFIGRFGKEYEDKACLILKWDAAGLVLSGKALMSYYLLIGQIEVFNSKKALNNEKIKSTQTKFFETQFDSLFKEIEKAMDSHLEMEVSRQIGSVSFSSALIPDSASVEERIIERASELPYLPEVNKLCVSLDNPLPKSLSSRVLSVFDLAVEGWDNFDDEVRDKFLASCNTVSEEISKNNMWNDGDAEEEIKIQIDVINSLFDKGVLSPAARHI